MKEFWNQRYQQEEYIYGTQPNVFLKEQLSLLPAGNILFPAEGEGRNAVYAAEQGWGVVAFDNSMAGRQKALKLSAQKGASIRYEIAGFEDFSWEGEPFACMALIYAHQPASLRQTYHRKLLPWLKPGGVLLVEAFSKHQLGKPSGGPRNTDMLYSKEELQEDFTELEIFVLEEVSTQLQEGNFHKGEASVIRLVGRKPVV